MYDLIGKDKDEMTLVIGSREIVMDSGTLVKTMDTGADAFTAIMPWQIGDDPELDSITGPFKYSNAKIYLGGILQSEQILYKVTQKTDSHGTTKNLEFASKTADIIDSTVVPPYEENYVKLSDRCKHQCRPFGINVIVGEDAAASLVETIKITETSGFKMSVKTQKFWDKTVTKEWAPYVDVEPTKKSKYVTDEKKFPRVAAKPTEEIFTHLSKLAHQCGLLLSCTIHGDLLITKANTKSQPVGTIEESFLDGTGLAEQYEAVFDGRKRFSQYRAILKSCGHKKSTYVQLSLDPVVTRPRLLTFTAHDDIPGGGAVDALWRRNKSAADAMSIDFPVNSWYAPNGDIWSPNTLVTIISPTMGIKKGFTYLISQVQFEYKSSGATAKLQLKPPSVYDNGEIKEPWIES